MATVDLYNLFVSDSISPHWFEQSNLIKVHKVFENSSENNYRCCTLWPCLYYSHQLDVVYCYL